MRGLVTAFRVSSRGFPRSKGRASSLSSATGLRTGVPHRGLASDSAQQDGEPRLRGVELACDGPEEGGDFARDRGHDHWQLFAGGAEATISGAQPELGFPGDVAHGFWQVLEA